MRLGCTFLWYMIGIGHKTQPLLTINFCQGQKAQKIPKMNVHDPMFLILTTFNIFLSLGHCQGDGYRVGFGPCSGTIVQALQQWNTRIVTRVFSHPFIDYKNWKTQTNTTTASLPTFHPRDLGWETFHLIGIFCQHWHWHDWIIKDKIETCADI